MKRKTNLYESTYKMENILSAFNEICRNTRNKRKVEKFKEFKCINIFKAYDVLKNRTYTPEEPFVFIIYEPKRRRIVSQNMHDKLINHLVSRYILYPALLPVLIEENVASRKDKGTFAGIEYFKKYSSLCKQKYKNYYILKGDISKFFQSINHEKLKRKLERRIKEKDSLDIIFKIIDIDKKGLSIGNMTSQILAIFYLNDFDHYVKEVLKIKYYIRYQDDFLLLHPSKEYLKECLEKIKIFLENEDLLLNKKTRIYKSTNNFIFLGRNNKFKYSKYRTVNRKIKKVKYLYQINKIDMVSCICSIRSYRSLLKNLQI